MRTTETSACPTNHRLFGVHDADVDEHVAACPRCRALRRLGYERTLAASSCAGIEPVLAARALGPLAEADERALLDHLEGCEACVALARDLDEAGVGGALVEMGMIDADDFPELRVVERENYIRGEEIGRGGMGRIVRARDRRLGRAVVLKELLDDRLRARFEQEARLTARLQHPAIVNVHEAGRWPSGDSFYAMKYVAGEPLDRVIDSRRTPAERLTLLPNVIIAVEAIAYAHSVKVIHRDLKPANILVGPFGETVVIDWGLAKELAQDDRGETGPYRDLGPALTVAGAGTPAYMPPEQAEGRTGDERTDVYALGATLYHVLAGAPPYGRGTSREVAKRMAEGPPPPLLSVAPSAPRALAAVVAKAMHPDPARRYAGAGELAEELKRFQDGRLVGAHRYSLTERAAGFARRNRALVTLGALSLVALLAVGGIGLRNTIDARRRAEHQLAEILVERGGQELLRGAPSRALPYLVEALRRGLDTPALRALLADAARPLDSLEKSFEIGGGPWSVARFSPDGRRLATSGYEPSVTLWAVPEGTPVAVLEGHAEPPDLLAFSPDGALLLTATSCGRALDGCDRTLRVWDAASGRLVAVVAHPEPVREASWADADTVLAATGDRAWAWEGRTGLLRATVGTPAGIRARPVWEGDRLTWAAPPTGRRILDFSPDGRWMLVGGEPGAARVEIWHVFANERVRTVEVEVPVVSARYGASGDTLVLRGADGSVRILDADWPVERGVLDAHDTPLVTAELGADGEQVFTLSENNRGAVWSARQRLLAAVTALPPVELAFDGAGRLLAFDGAGEGRIFRPDGALALRAPSATMHWQPPLLGARRWRSDDGRQVYGLRSTAGDAIEAVLWDAASGRELRAFPIVHVPTEVRRDVRLAAGGATLAAVAGERRVGVWRIADGRQLAMLVAPGPVHDLAFDPAGLRIAVAGDGGAGIWDLDGRVLATVSHIGVSRVAWSPDGQRLASAGGDGYARVWDADGGLPLQVLGQVGSSTDEMRFSPAGDRLAVHSSTGMLTYWDTRVDARPLADALALADRSAFLLEGTTLVSHPRMAPPEAEQPRDRRTRQLLAMVLDRRYHEAALGFAEAHESQGGAEALFMAAAAASAAGNVGEATRRLAEYRRTGAAPAPRHAGDRLVTIEEIRRRYELGQDYYEKRRYAESAAEFLGAAMVTQVPSLYFNAAVSLEKLNRPEEAAAYFRRYLALAPNARDRERTQARIAVLEASE